MNKALPWINSFLHRKRAQHTWKVSHGKCVHGKCRPPPAIICASLLKPTQMKSHGTTSQGPTSVDNTTFQLVIFKIQKQKQLENDSKEEQHLRLPRMLLKMFSFLLSNILSPVTLSRRVHTSAAGKYCHQIHLKMLVYFHKTLQIPLAPVEVLPTITGISLITGCFCNSCKIQRKFRRISDNCWENQLPV